MWRSKQQGIVALSSSEAEYISLSDAVKEIVFVVQILESMGIKIETPIKVNVDNMGAIFMSQNASTHSRTRHVDVRYHFVRELQDGPKRMIEVVFCRTNANISDGFTKNVKSEVHEQHEKEMVMDKEEVFSKEDVSK